MSYYHSWKGLVACWCYLGCFEVWVPISLRCRFKPQLGGEIKEISFVSRLLLDFREELQALGVENRCSS